MEEVACYSLWDLNNANPQERARRLAAVKAAHTSADALLGVLSGDDAQSIADACSWRRFGVADPATGVHPTREDPVLQLARMPTVAISTLAERGGWKALRDRFIDGRPNLRCPAGSPNLRSLRLQPEDLTTALQLESLPVLLLGGEISWRSAIRVCDLGIMRLMIMGGGPRVWRLMLADAPLLDAICAAASGGSAVGASSASAELLAMQAMRLVSDVLPMSSEVREELARRELWRPAVEWLQRAEPALENLISSTGFRSVLGYPDFALVMAHSATLVVQYLLSHDGMTERTSRAAGGDAGWDIDDKRNFSFPPTRARCRGVVAGVLGAGLIPTAERVLSALSTRLDRIRSPSPFPPSRAPPPPLPPSPLFLI
eukprot:tig00000194_g14807.t1